MSPEIRQFGEWDWVTATNPRVMLDYIRGRVSERKRRLFACGCCHLIRHLIVDQRSWEAVVVAERYSDGLAKSGELDRVASIANEVWLDLEDVVSRRAGEAAYQCAEVLPEEIWQLDHAWASAARAIEGNELRRTWQGSPEELTRALDSWSLESDEAGEEPIGRTEADPEAEMASLLRCIVGNPFRTVTFNPSWLTFTVVALARGIYDDRAFDRLPILADALEDAGCEHPDILGHCRGDGPHARGCWVVDLLLGKS